jgi:protein-ribulosamine 3-kinase
LRIFGNTVHGVAVTSVPELNVPFFVLVWMQLSSDLSKSIALTLEKATGGTAELRVLQPVRGGDINEAFRITYGNQTFFVKTNSNDRFPGMMQAEAKGLELIRNTGCVRVPEVIGAGTSGNQQFLILEWVNTGNPAAGAEALGSALAALHRNTAELFGLDHHNYMGALLQKNDRSETFSEFFLGSRILPQLQLAKAKGLIPSSLVDPALYERVLQAHFADEAPALVHGDLWSGNFMIDSRGEPYLIDPAVAFSSREVDIAMTRLFGGFPDQFYEAYCRHFPLRPGWKDRIPLLNLYPLLIHLNLFGESYLPAVLRSVDCFREQGTRL